MSAACTDTTRHAEERLGDRLLNVAAYVSVTAGYVMSILISGHVSVSGLALLTLATLGWLWCYWRLLTRPESFSQVPVWLPTLFLAMTLLVLAAPWLGTGFDWLLPMVTVAVLVVGYPWRTATVLAIGVWLATTLNIAALEHTGSHVDAVYILQDQVSLATGFAFVYAISLVFNLQMKQRARAEALVEQLEAAQAQLRTSASAAEELAITRERNRMAREIHDTLGHYLTIMTVKLETAMKLEEHGDGRLREELVEARRVATECLAEVRHSVAALRPADPSAGQLPLALTRLAGEFQSVAPDVEMVLDVEGLVREMAPELRAALYRCAQEALTNVRKHAHATKVLVRLRVDERQAELTVLDNGVGADGERERQPGFGLLGMRERIDLLRGTASAGPEPDRGWRVEVVVPLAAPVSDGDGVHSPRVRAPVPVEG
jgi:signal transduction histidine kinase